jgi:hypothetical protein
METQILIADQDNHIISANKSEFELSLKRSNIEDPKKMKAFIKTCEAMIRKSPEYSDWRDFIHEVLQLYKCEITGELHVHATCDIHHHPVSLYVITKGVINKYISEEIPFSSYDICSDVIQLHYDLKVPFVVLLKSMHEKFHNGFLKIPIELTHGDLRHFIDNYRDYIDDDDIDVIYERLNTTFKNCGWGNKYKWSKETYIVSDLDVEESED